MLRNFLEHTFLRRLSIFLPVVFLIFGFIVLAPRVGFEIFPTDDNAYTSISITGPVGQRTEVTHKDLDGITSAFLGYPEVKYATVNIRDNKADISIQLTKKDERVKL